MSMNSIYGYVSIGVSIWCINIYRGVCLYFSNLTYHRMCVDMML